MQLENLVKQITSKDINLSKKIIKEIIDTENINAFKEICNKSDFIFPFLKDRIINDFVNFINKDNLNTVFKFAKVYNYDFEDIILKSWIKFANEDLTDKILDLFENATDDEKIYASKYFSYIKDPLVLEFLYQNSKSENEILKMSCANTLKEFNDVKIFNEMLETIKKTSDDFEKFSAFQFIIAYDDKKYLNFILDNAFLSPFASDIILLVKEYYSFEYLKNNIDLEKLTRFFSIMIENYPENVSLNTLIYYEIFEFIKYFSTFNCQYIKNILFVTKEKFSEFNKNEAYLFDLDKDNKIEIKKISEFLENVNYDFNELQKELEFYIEKPYNFEIALNIVKLRKETKYCDFLSKLVNENKVNLTLMAKISQVLKELDNFDLLDKNNIDSIQDVNIKMLILSYFN